MDDRSLLLERFHLALVASIERANPGYLREAFTIGEIYEDLIPYRTHRDLIGVAMNGDYEDGLMRLLAGEGEYVIVESEEALRAIREELENKAPDTGLFKRFRDVAVRLDPERLGASVPERRGSGVARLFDEGVGKEQDSTGETKTRNGWGLGNPGEDRDSHQRAIPSDPVARRRPGAAASPSTPRDEVQKPERFWEERRAEEGEEEDVPAGGRMDDLEAENRRLKILLAERVLEVEELRERLSQGKTGARRDKS